MTAFVPRGERPQWEVVYDVLSAAKVGDVVSYATLSEALGFDITKNRTPYLKAVRVLEEQKKRTADCVRGEGYRIVEAREHAGLASRQHRGAKRKLKRGHEIAQAADRSRMTPEERQRIDAMELTLSRQQLAINRLESRTAAMDGAIKKNRREAKADVAGVSERVTKLEAALARLGEAELQAPGDATQ